MAATPRDASTVIVLRENNSEGFETFLLKRNEKSAFMGNNYVYPGGVVDTRDSDPRIFPFCKGIPSEEGQKELLPFMVAGIRELFEEAGILLAYDENGHPLATYEAESRGRFSHYRDLLHKKEITLIQIARDEKIFFALDQLHHYAHWITPEARPLRFNTHFFIARYPAGQKASADETETSDGTWMTPGTALEKSLSAVLILSPPTMKTLEDLSRFRTTEEAISFSKTCEKPPILSLLLAISNDWFLVFPWDPEYESLRKGEIPLCPDHGRISTPVDNTSRILTKDGRNIPYCKK